MTHKKWLVKFNEKNASGEKYKKRIIDSINSTGAPLELRTIDKLTEKGFRAKEGYYIDIDLKDAKKVTRQIDVIGYGENKKIDLIIKDCSIYFGTIIIADCKHSDDRDLLVFEIPKHDLGNVIFRYPILTNGNRFNYSFMQNSISLKRFSEFFDIRVFSGKIIDIKEDKGELKTLRKGDEKETNLFRNCEQIMPAVLHYYKRYEQFVRTDIINIWKSHFEREYEIIKKDLESKGSITAGRVNKMAYEEIIKKPPPLGDIHFPIYCFIPMLIVDEDVGLIKVIPEKDKSYPIENLEEIPFCLYMHTPTDSDKYDEILEGKYYQPILICNIKSLDECIKMLEIGIEKIKREMKFAIETHPRRLVEEIASFYLNV